MSGSVWVKVHPDYAGGGNGTLDPAELLSDPVAVVNATNPGSYTVKLTDGTSKKIWFLPGNAASDDLATYSVTLSPGSLLGVMVGAGGQGGSSETNGAWPTGGGGAGGVIGTGCHVPVILPSPDAKTYIIKVANSKASENYGVRMSPSTTIEVQGQKPFTAALGGGLGNTKITPDRGGGSGASGGGGRGGYGGPDSVNIGNHYFHGVPGQGHDGNYGSSNMSCGGGGGYGSGGQEVFDGGEGFDLATALMLDDSDVDTKSFIDMVSVDGWIAGGGAAQNGTATAGGGAYRGNAKDYTGGGGGGVGANDDRTGGMGGCGMVLLVTEV